MPPKKKAGGKKGGKEGKSKKGEKGGESSGPVAEPDEYDAMDLEELEAQLLVRAEKLNEIKKSRNFFQLERDQVQQFHDVVRQEVLDTEAHVRNIESQMERMEDTHRNDVRIYLQKVVHLEYEHESNVEAVQKAAGKEGTSEEERHRARKSAMLREKEQLKRALEEDERHYAELVRHLKEVNTKEMAKLRQEFDKNYGDLAGQYDKRLAELQDELELRRKMEIHEIEERKNKHINDLMRNHEKAFEEMRNYYNSITQDNLDLIKTFKEDLVELKAKAAESDKAIVDITKRNDLLSEPLSHAEERVASLRARLSNFDKVRASLRLAKARLVHMEERLRASEEEHAALRQTYDGAVAERDRLYDDFAAEVEGAQRASQARNEDLERKVQEFKDAFDTKRTQFSAVLRASNLDPAVVQDVTERLDRVLAGKNQRIRDLRYEAAKIAKVHDDLLRVYHAKLPELGIPAGELDLREPLANAVAL